MRTMKRRWLSSVQVKCESYSQGLPFSHCVIDGLFNPAPCAELAGAFPPFDMPGWFHYDNALERKSVYRERYGEQEIVQSLYNTLGDDGFLSLLEQLTDIPGLMWDNDLYAAGLCAATQGGKLDLHRDANVHPEHGWKRELSCVLFLNRDWQEEWQGGLELWSERDAKPFNREKVIQPRLGRFVIFDPSGFHGYPELLACPQDIVRKSVQVFYWSAGEGPRDRRRATFAPRPTDPLDKELDRLRAERAG